MDKASKSAEQPADPGAITTLEADLATASDRQQVATVAVRIAA